MTRELTVAGGYDILSVYGQSGRILSPRCARVSQSVCRPYADAEVHPPSKKASEYVNLPFIYYDFVGSIPTREISLVDRSG